MQLIGRLADHLGHTQHFQIQRHQNAGGQIAADGHDGAVQVPHAQGFQDLLIPGIAHHGVGYAVGDLLYLFRPAVDDHDLVAQLMELQRHGCAEAAQSHY